MSGFHKVVWDEVKDLDTLGGRPLLTGDRVVVRWGDGTSSSHTVTVNKHGEAFVEVTYRGVPLKVFLLDNDLSAARDK
jgi:hypothetical protein